MTTFNHGLTARNNSFPVGAFMIVVTFAVVNLVQDENEVQMNRTYMSMLQDSLGLKK